LSLLFAFVNTNIHLLHITNQIFFNVFSKNVMNGK